MNGKREYDLRDQERREQAANVRVGALCRVEKFDPAAMRVDVQPLSKALDAGGDRTQPQILSVPVALVRGGGFVLRPCYKSGDVGVLLYIDHDIDRIAASGEESEPNTERNHSDEDAVFIGAFVPSSNPLSGLPDAPTRSLRKCRRIEEVKSRMDRKFSRIENLWPRDGSCIRRYRCSSRAAW